MIPASFIPIALQAVASGDERLIGQTAVQLGLSAPALVQHAVHLCDDPLVVAANPRPCRIIRERVEAAAARRGSRPVSI